MAYEAWLRFFAACHPTLKTSVCDEYGDDSSQKVLEFRRHCHKYTLLRQAVAQKTAVNGAKTIPNTLEINSPPMITILDANGGIDPFIGFYTNEVRLTAP